MYERKTEQKKSELWKFWPQFSYRCTTDYSLWRETDRDLIVTFIR